MMHPVVLHQESWLSNALWLLYLTILEMDLGGHKPLRRGRGGVPIVSFWGRRTGLSNCSKTSLH